MNQGYYTVQNSAKRLGCSATTIRRAIRKGLFTDVIYDTSAPGSPAYMIPSDQIEKYVDEGGILLRRSRTTGKNPNYDLADKLGANKWHQSNRLDVDAISQRQKLLNEELEEKGHITLSETANALGLDIPVPENDVGWFKDLQPAKTPGKILIEIDSSTIEKAINQQLKKRIQNLRAAIDILTEELDAIEAMF